MAHDLLVHRAVASWQSVCVVVLGGRTSEVEWCGLLKAAEPQHSP